MKKNTRPVAIFAGLALAALGLFVAAPAVAATVTSNQVAFVASDIEFSTVSPDGSLIAYSVYGFSEVMLLNTHTHLVTTVSDVGEALDGAGGMVFSPNGSTLYVASYDSSTVIVIDVVSTTVSEVLATDAFSGPWVLSISPDGNTLFVGEYHNHAIVAYDLLSDAATSTPSVSSPYAMFISPDGTKLYNVDYYGTVDVFDTATETIIDTYNSVEGDFYSACTNSDVTMLFLPDSETPALHALSLVTGELIASNTTALPAGKNYSCAVSPDGGKVFVTNIEIGEDAPPVVTVPGVVTEFDAATLAFEATHVFSGVAYTQVMNFYDDCNAFVAGFYGNAQVLNLGGACAPPTPAPELAATGMDSSATGALLAGGAFLAVLGGATLVVSRQRKKTL